MANVGERFARRNNPNWPPRESSPASAEGNRQTTTMTAADGEDDGWGTEAAADEWAQADRAQASSRQDRNPDSWSDNGDSSQMQQRGRSDGFGGTARYSSGSRNFDQQQDSRNGGYGARSQNASYDNRPERSTGGRGGFGNVGHADSRSNGFDGRAPSRRTDFDERRNGGGYRGSNSASNGYNDDPYRSNRSNDYNNSGGNDNYPRADRYNEQNSYRPNNLNSSGRGGFQNSQRSSRAYDNGPSGSYNRSDGRDTRERRSGNDRYGSSGFQGPPANDSRSYNRNYERPDEPTGNRFQNERSRYQQPDPVTSRPIYEAERPRRAQFGEDNVNRRTAEVLGPYQEKARRFQEAEAGRQRQQNGEHSQDQAVRKPPSSYVPRDVDVDELFIADKECASQSTLDTDDIIFEDNTEPSDFVPFKTWKDANLPEALMTNIRNCGYKEPRNIQAFTMPLIENDHDVLGQAETGSGKSAAFLLPIIKHCMITKKKDDLLAGAPVALIICPTRELVSQLYDQGRKFATGCNVQVQRAYGEFKVYENARQIRLGCDILVATVGRLKQFVDDGTVKFDNLTYLVLDEADHLIETNHYDSLLDIIRHPKFPDISHRQTLLFSATFSAEVEGVATKILRSERKVIISNRRKTSANTKITQEFRMVKKDQKKDELLKMLKDEQQKNGSIKRTIVFVQMKRQADVLAAFISMADIKATTIHGDRSQQLREEALRDFKGNTRVLVTTDVCARGIDILDLDHVVNFDLPNDKTTYIHRIGRTGRTREGLATSFIDPTDSQDQQISRDLIEIAAEAGQEVPPFLVKLADEGCEENGEE